MLYQSPNGNKRVECHSNAFVNNTQNGLTDAHLSQAWLLDKFIHNLQTMAQTWDRILTCLGGVLELTKCSYYVILWMRVQGLPPWPNKQISSRWSHQTHIQNKSKSNFYYPTRLYRIAQNLGNSCESNWRQHGTERRFQGRRKLDCFADKFIASYKDRSNGKKKGMHAK